MRVAIVKYEFRMPVPVPEGYSDDTFEFAVQENSSFMCGYAGTVFDRIVDFHDGNSTCPSCSLGAVGTIERYEDWDDSELARAGLGTKEARA